MNGCSACLSDEIFYTPRLDEGIIKAAHECSPAPGVFDPTGCSLDDAMSEDQEPIFRPHPVVLCLAQRKLKRSDLQIPSLLLDKKAEIIMQALDLFRIEGCVISAAAGANRLFFRVACASEYDQKKLIDHQAQMAQMLNVNTIGVGPVQPVDSDRLEWDHWCDEEIYEYGDDDDSELDAECKEWLISIERQGHHLQIEMRNPYPLHLGDLLTRDFRRKTDKQPDLPLILGRDDDGVEIILDFAQINHLLVGGTSRDETTSFLRSVLVGWSCCKLPHELRLILIDRNKTAFNDFQIDPYLAYPVVHCHQQEITVLKWVARHISDRTKLLHSRNVKTIEEYWNSLEQHPSQASDLESPEVLPRIAIVINEFADLTRTHGDEVETLICEIARLGHTVGVHLLLTTQDAAQVADGFVGAMVPNRICFQTETGVESQTLLNCDGAELLLGDGDMLIQTQNNVVRVQGTSVSSEEIKNVFQVINRSLNRRYDQELFRISDSDLQS